jgi:hypothetical protein
VQARFGFRASWLKYALHICPATKVSKKNAENLEFS